MKKRNPIVRELHNTKYRNRIVPNKKKGYDETYDWVAELYEEQDGKTEEDRRTDKTIQSDDDS